MNRKSKLKSLQLSKMIMTNSNKNKNKRYHNLKKFKSK